MHVTDREEFPCWIACDGKGPLAPDSYGRPAVTLCGEPITDRDLSTRDARNVKPGGVTARAWKLCERCHDLAQR